MFQITAISCQKLKIKLMTLALFHFSRQFLQRSLLDHEMRRVLFRLLTAVLQVTSNPSSFSYHFDTSFDSMGREYGKGIAGMAGLCSVTARAVAGKFSFRDDSVAGAGVLGGDFTPVPGTGWDLGCALSPSTWLTAWGVQSSETPGMGVLGARSKWVVN